MRPKKKQRRAWKLQIRTQKAFINSFLKGKRTPKCIAKRAKPLDPIVTYAGPWTFGIYQQPGNER